MPRRGRFLIAAATVVLAAGCGGGPAAEAPAGASAIRLVADEASPHYGAVEAVGLDPLRLAELDGLSSDEWRTAFPVYTGAELPAGGDDKPSVLGSYSIAGGVVRFQPRFPFVAGLSYSARLDLGGAEPLVASFALPADDSAPETLVDAVFPTADELPENLLRLYVHFSSSMSRGEAYERVRLFDAAGEEVAEPFVEIEQELWDGGMRRLTLLFDPGRIKRGLRPHDEVGPPLVEGKSYRLVIDAEWLDGRGLPLSEGFEKAFTVTAADRKSPDPATWGLEAPAAGGRAALVLSFPEPLDQALVTRLVRPTDAAGREVAGRAETSDGERRWEFVPDEPWRPGSYAVEVGTILEDLAGNSIQKIFDFDLESDAPGVEEERISLPFEVGS